MHTNENLSILFFIRAQYQYQLLIHSTSTKFQIWYFEIEFISKCVPDAETDLRSSVLDRRGKAGVHNGVETKAKYNSRNQESIGAKQGLTTTTTLYNSPHYLARNKTNL